MKATNKKNVKETNTVKSTTKVETSKTTTAKKTSKVQSMIATLQSMVDKITDKKLKAEVQNSLKVKNPKESDLAALIKRVIDTGKQPVVANEAKPVVKKTTTKKTEDKSTEKKPATKETVKSLKTSGDTKPPKALYFPDTITAGIDGKSVTLNRVTDDKLTTMDELVNYIKDNDAIDKVFIATYWTARHIKQYNYAALNKITQSGVVPKSFENDLDITQVITYSEKTERLWSMSITTDAMYMFYSTDFVPVEDTNPYNGEKYAVRVSNGMEFAIYIEAEPPKTKKTVKKTK